MDLLDLFTILWRHRWTVLAVVVLVIGGNAYVALGIPPRFESEVQYVMVYPPPAPSDAEIARDPALGRLNANNPYLRLPSQTVIVDVLAQRISSDDIRKQLVSAGADADYQITPTNAFGSGSVIAIVGTGRSAKASLTTISVVSARMQSELRTMQKVSGADDRFLAQTLQVSAPATPVQKVTGTIRSMIAVTAAGVVLIFALISLTEGAAGRRRVRPSAVVKRGVEVPARRPGEHNSSDGAVGRASVHQKT